MQSTEPATATKVQGKQSDLKDVHGMQGDMRIQYKIRKSTEMIPTKDLGLRHVVKSMCPHTGTQNSNESPQPGKVMPHCTLKETIQNCAYMLSNTHRGSPDLQRQRTCLDHVPKVHHNAPHTPAIHCPSSQQHWRSPKPS